MPHHQRHRPYIDAYGERFEASKDDDGNQGYVLRNTDPTSPHTEIATIYPSDPRQSVHSKNNAALRTCEYKTGYHELHSINGLDESMRRAAEHAVHFRDDHSEIEDDRRAAEVGFADLRAAEAEKAKEQDRSRFAAALAKLTGKGASEEKKVDLAADVERAVSKGQDWKSGRGSSDGPKPVKRSRSNRRRWRDQDKDRGR